jgi:large subunit ribosomal protein L22
VATVEAPLTEVRAEAKYVRAAPRKTQLVVDQIRGRTVPEARAILAFLERDAARDVERVLTSAVANAETNHGLLGDDLYVSAAYVGAGPTLKRWRARARGRVARIKKRTCHITVTLAMPSGEAIPEPRGSVVIEPPPAEPAPTPAEKAPKPERERAGDAASETEKPKRTPRKRAGEPTEKEKSKSESKPKAEAKPKRAAKPKAAADAAEKPKRAPRKKKKES